jgi:hypothetical protein
MERRTPEPLWTHICGGLPGCAGADPLSVAAEAHRAAVPARRATPALRAERGPHLVRRTQRRRGRLKPAACLAPRPVHGRSPALAWLREQGAARGGDIRRRDRVLGTHRRCVGLNQVAGSPVFQNRTTNHREPRSTPQIRCVRSLGAGNNEGSTSYSGAMSRPRSAATSSARAIPWRENGAVRLYLPAHVYPPLCNW